MPVCAGQQLHMHVSISQQVCVCVCVCRANIITHCCAQSLKTEKVCCKHIHVRKTISKFITKLISSDVDNCLFFYQAHLSNVLWFNLLKCEDLLFFLSFISFEIEHLWVLDCWANKTYNSKHVTSGSGKL